MKLKNNQLCAIVLILLLSCGTDDPKTSATAMPIAENAVAPSNETEQGEIVGEWEQLYTCFDKNGNYKLEPEEKIASGTRLGFDWFRFNVDGTCLRDKDMKFKALIRYRKKTEQKKLSLKVAIIFTIQLLN